MAIASQYIKINSYLIEDKLSLSLITDRISHLKADVRDLYDLVLRNSRLGQDTEPEYKEIHIANNEIRMLTAMVDSYRKLNCKIRGHEVLDDIE